MKIEDFITYFNFTFISMIYDNYKYTYVKMSQNPPESYISCKFTITKQDENQLKNKKSYLTLHGKSRRFYLTPKILNLIKENKMYNKETNTFSINNSIINLKDACEKRLNIESTDDLSSLVNYEELYYKLYKQDEREKLKEELNKNNKKEVEDIGDYFNKGNQLLSLYLTKYNSSLNTFEYINSISLPEEKVHLDISDLKQGEYYIFARTLKKYILFDDAELYDLVISMYSPIEIMFKEIKPMDVSKTFYSEIMTDFLIKRTIPVNELSNDVFNNDNIKPKQYTDFIKNIAFTSKIHIPDANSITIKQESFINNTDISNKYLDIYYTHTFSKYKLDCLVFLFKNKSLSDHIEVDFQIIYFENSLIPICDFDITHETIMLSTEDYNSNKIVDDGIYEFKNTNNHADNHSTTKDDANCFKYNLNKCSIIIPPNNYSLIILKYNTLGKNHDLKIKKCKSSIKNITFEDKIRLMIKENIDKHSKERINEDCLYEEIEYEKGIIIVFYNQSSSSSYRFKVNLEELENLRIIFPRKLPLIFTINIKKFEFIVLEKIQRDIDEIDYDIQYVYKKNN